MNLLLAPMRLAVAMPAGLSQTIDNFMLGGQIVGGGLAGFFLVIAAIQLMSGGRNAVEMSKTKIICVIVGMIVLAGCSVIRVWISGLIAF